MHAAAACIGCSPWTPLWMHAANARRIRVSPLDTAERARTQAQNVRRERLES
jgi:hypothetical protein